MLKYQKKMIDNSIELLEKAHSEIYMQINHGKLSEIPELLQLCQELMIGIGENVEKNEVNYSGIHDMEVYCEYVYQISCNLEQINNSMALLQELYHMFDKIKAQLNNIHLKIEVVFFPYNAAMWDSLESIWIAADQDPEVEALVVPIPYYEKNGEDFVEKYDLEKFPPYVPVIDYRNYNLTERKPDIAYIHNPYDQFNLVTSVHPDYYSYELKKNVTKLVYVPYFMIYNEVSNSHRELPLYYHVDYIVVSSENTINSFAQNIKREKFIPFGSPIFDRLIRLDKKRPLIPENWKLMLPNGEDFCGKKAIMYNTSLSMVMKRRENFIDKIEDVINSFREIDDVILVWRPHPLMHATLQAIGGGLYQRFLDIENMFLKEKIGILDKTADVGIAVTLCDAYIGEEASSIIHMFGVTGKPRFFVNLQTYLEFSGADECNVTAFSSFIEGEIEWFVAEEYRCLCKWNRIDGVVEVITQIPGTKAYPYGAYRDIIKSGDNIYLQPYSGQGLVIYNLSNNSIRKIYVRDSAPYSFRRMFIKNNALYLIPKEYPYLVRFDIETENLKYYMPAEVDIQEVLEFFEVPDLEPQRIVYQLPRKIVRKFKAEELGKRTRKGVVWEDKDNRLRDYLYYITEEGLHNTDQARQSYINNIANLDGTCGEKIHEFVKKGLDKTAS